MFATSFGIILAIQIAFFIIAATRKTDKVTDLAYGLTFAVVAVYLYLTTRTPQALLIASLVGVWGLRLSGYLFIRILKTGTDKRFDGIRNDWRKFAKFWLLQAISIWMISLNFIYFSSFGQAYSVLGIFIFVLGLALESLADLQKFAFKSLPENKNKWVDVGLWKFSRHPNYFGEMLVWWGIFIFTLPSLSGTSYLFVISPIFITTLLLFVTGIPTIERKYDALFGGQREYQFYRETTNLLVPFKISKK